MVQLVEFSAKDVGNVAETKDVSLTVYTKDSGVTLLQLILVDFRYGNVITEESYRVNFPF